MSDLSELPSGQQLLKMDSREAGRILSSLPLEQQRELILSMAPDRKRQDLILLAERPEALTRVLPPEEVVLTIKEIGDQDALPLVEMSSNAQLAYLFDLDLWIQADLDMRQLEHWLTLLLECGPDRTLRWLEHCDFELLVILFERSVLLLDRESLDDLPDILLGRVVTPDDFHYLVVKLGANLELMRQLIDLLFSRVQDLFFAITGNLGTSPPAEVEELSLRWRNSRLADRGWPDLDEAQAFYQPLDPARLSAEARLPSGLSNPPRHAITAARSGGLLRQGLAQVADDLNANLASQLANLINRVMIADGMPLAEPASMEQASRRTMGRLEIGLVELGASDGPSAGRTLASTPLLFVVQVAQRAIVERRTRALRLQSASTAGLLEMMRAPLPERLAALCRQRPVFADQAGAGPREFDSSRDLLELDRDLDRAEAALLLGQALGLKRDQLPKPFPAGSHPESVEGLDLEAMLTTAHARHLLALPEPFGPIPFARLADLFSAYDPDPKALAAQIRRWAEDLHKVHGPGLAALLGDMAERLVDQFGQVDPADLDPRFLEGLWILQP